MAFADTPSPAVFDADHLARYTSGDAALERELAGLLRDQCVRSLAAMDAAHDAPAWQAACHTLKGAARGMGAFALAESCERAEAAGRAQWPVALQSVRAAAATALDAIDSALSD